ncbi:MAG TPA: CTP synthase, partial [Flavobacteriaceae bacterium]|nr:CTP synthase [Flavobacteriaceae bacterium]
GLKDANSTEMNKTTEYPVISLMEEQKNISNMGGTMRLGAWDCKLTEKSKVFEAYESEMISERHRHRYEFNNDFLDQVTNAGMKVSGVNPKTNLVEIIEIPDHPWFVGVQYHPEYKSTVLNPHPLFVAFVKACLEHS